MNTNQQTATPVGGQQTTRAAEVNSSEARVSYFYTTALLIDGAWFSKALGHFLNVEWPDADTIHDKAMSIMLAEEKIYRLFFYESKPCEDYVINPITKNGRNLKNSPSYVARTRFFSELAAKPFVALRRGEAKFRGWVLTDNYIDEIMKKAVPARPIAERDIRMDITQKGVDMRIGIDVATLAIKRLVDRIIIFTGDADLIPAIKLARMEGVQVGVVKVGTWNVQGGLVEDSDFIRELPIKTLV